MRLWPPTFMNGLQNSFNGTDIPETEGSNANKANALQDTLGGVLGGGPSADQGASGGGISGGAGSGWWSETYADGPRLWVSNGSGEFETSTAIPVKVAKLEMDRGADLTDGFNVHKVTVEERPNQATFISMADTSGIGERTVLVTPDGKLQFFLREA